MNTRTFRYVPNIDVRKLLTPADAVRLARETLVQHTKGTVDWAVPRQMSLGVSDSSTFYKVKGCVLRDAGVAGFRVVGLNRTDEGYATAAHRPTKNVLLSDAETGAFFAIVDERWAYGLRTGACAAVTVEALRLPDSRDCSLIGAGPMAYAAALAVNEVMPLEVVRVHSRTPEHRQEFADRLSADIGVPVEPVADPETCLRDATVVITASTAPEPFLKHEWLRPGVIVYAMGGGHEWERACYQRMRVIVDDREQATFVTEIRRWLEEDSFDLGTDVEADLAEVITGTAGQRTSEEDQFFVRSQGLVTQDVAQAYWIYNQAVERRLGVDLEKTLNETPGDSLF